MTPTLPNRVAASVLTLPLAIAIGLLVWMLTGWGMLSIEWGLCIVAAGVTTYLLMELNNRHALIRTRTYITSSVYWLALAATPCVHDRPWAMITALCMVASFLCMFSTYDRPRSEVAIFHSFIFITIATVLCPPLALCIPAGWLYLIIYIRSMSGRTFVASLLGVLLTLIVIVCIMFVAGRGGDCLSHITDTVVSLIDGSWFAAYSARLSDVYKSDIITPAYFVGFMSLVLGGRSLYYYPTNSYDDKIRTRMLNYIIIVQWCLLQLTAALFPWHLERLLPSIWLCTAPLMGHQFALCRSIFGTIFFIICIIIYPLWLSYVIVDS